MAFRSRPLATLSACLLLAAFNSSATAQATTGQADVPDAVSGTYAVSFDSTATGDLPYKVNETVQLVIDGATNSLCIKGERQLFDSKDSQTFFKALNSFETTLSGQYKFTYTLQLENNAFKEVFVYGGSTFVGNTVVNNQGYLRGTKTSTSTDCSALGISAVISLNSAEQSALTLAEEIYPTILKQGGALGLYQGYTYKYYAASQVYVGFKDGKIFTMGGAFGPAIKEQGSTSAVYGALQAMKTKILNTGSFTLSGANPSTHNTTLDFATGYPGLLEISSNKSCQIYVESVLASNGVRYFVELQYRQSDKAVVSASLGSGSFNTKVGDGITAGVAGLTLDKASGKVIFNNLTMTGSNGSTVTANGTFSIPVSKIAACVL